MGPCTAEVRSGVGRTPIASRRRRPVHRRERDVGWIAPGDHFYFDDVDFGAVAPARLDARVASGASSGTAELRLDRVDGPVIARLAIAPTGGWTRWVTRSASVGATATGRHRLYWVFTGPGGDFVNVSWSRFE
jgi:hypothetical protein